MESQVENDYFGINDYSSGDIISQLIEGKIATVPTETVEGYAVSLESVAGIQELMNIKSRGFDSGKVFTLVPESVASIGKYAVIPPAATHLIRQFMPGELTLILPKSPDFTHFYYDHYDTIGVRIPQHPLFDEIRKCVGPVLLTSANPRGGTPRSMTGHLPSTIVDFTSQVPCIVRQGNLQIDLASFLLNTRGT